MNGIIVLDKPQGKTSHDMVNFIRRIAKTRRVGHTGTLDPMATGVLPICIGNATKAADMLTLSDKRYIAEFKPGITTDTQDISGNILTENKARVTQDDIETAIKLFIGEIKQIPPMYSAVKMNGKKLYELARQGIEVERQPRNITIYAIDILNIDMNELSVTIDVHCSKGTYIRTLCADIGAKLGVGACMTSLRRTATGIFTIENSFTPEQLEDGISDDFILPTDKMFDDYPSIQLNEKQTRSIVNGVRMTWRTGVENQSYRLYDENGQFLCISKCIDGKLQLEKSFWSC